MLGDRDINNTNTTIKYNHNDRLDELEEQLLELERKITKHHDRILDKTDRLLATNEHICDTLNSHMQTLNNQASTITSTKRIVSAQARTISAQAQKITRQQELIDMIQRDIFRLARWHVESQSRINAHGEMLTDRDDDLRLLGRMLRRHIAFVDEVIKETFWMNVYTKQLMMLRAAELEYAATTSTTRTTGGASINNSDGRTSTEPSALCILPAGAPRHILLDRIVVQMVREHLPDRYQKVCDGFETTHGISPHSFENNITKPD